MPTPYCRHIRTNGRRCCAFAVRGESFCYFHRSVNARHRSLRRPDDGTANIIHPLNLDPGKLQREPLLAEYYSHTRGPLELNFPTLEDRESIQIALSMLLKALGENRLEPKRAVTMLYGLQVASSNARDLNVSECHVVRETVYDDSGLELALDEDPEEIVEREEFLADLEREEAEQAAAQEAEEEARFDWLTRPLEPNSLPSSTAPLAPQPLESPQG